MLPSRAPSFDRVATEESRARLAALARAKVLANERHRQPANEAIDCRFVDTPVTGTTPKFDCTTESGDTIRVKYGSLELHAEVAATSLLSALGFGADDVAMTGRVRCYGCPRLPFPTRQIAQRLHLTKYFEEQVIDYDRYSDFEWVAVERKGRYRSLKFGSEEGWAFYELSRIDPALGGAAPAEVDALRLAAVFLSHWDNKMSNQRLACPAAGAETCEHPLAMLQDVGSTFGPKKVDLADWSRTPIWSDASTCTLSMEELPYDGGTFNEVRISEAGRRLLAERFLGIGTDDVRALFTNARFDNVDGWIAAFERRVDEIAHRPPCPPLSPAVTPVDN